MNEDRKEWEFVKKTEHSCIALNANYIACGSKETGEG